MKPTPDESQIAALKIALDSLTEEVRLMRTQLARP